MRRWGRRGGAADTAVADRATAGPPVQKGLVPERAAPERPVGEPGGPVAEAVPPGPGEPPLSPALRMTAMALAFAGMVGFAVVLARLTLEPSAASVPLTHTNVRPGDSIADYINQGTFRDTVKQLGGNILLGVPFGVLLPVLVPRARGLIRVVLATAVVMVLVELVQGAIVTGRAFDIDDVILNSAGALLGYLVLGRRLGRSVHPRRRHWWHRLRRRPAPAPADPGAASRP